MKILYIRPYFPSSLLYGGELRNRWFVDYLRKKGDVDMFILVRGGKEMDQEYLRTKFKRFYFAEKLGSTSSWEKFKYFLPWQLAQLYSKETQAQLNALVERENYDLIFVNKLFPVPYALRLPSQWHDRVVVDFDDVLSDLFRSSYKDFIKSRKNSLFLKMNEEMALKKFKKIFVCAEDALTKIKPEYHKKVGIVPNVFTVSRNHMFEPAADKNRLLFVGSLDYEPNAEGLEWFLKNVWPGVKTQFPYLKLSIVGKAPKPEIVLARFKNYADISMELNVPDVKPYYKESFASVVPLLNGSGTRLKILESYAYGRPVLTTQKGMEGLDFTDTKDIYVFENKETFCAGYCELLNDGHYRKVCSEGFSVLENKYSPAAFEKNMDDHWAFINRGEKQK